MKLNMPVSMQERKCQMKNNAGYKTAYGECLCIDSLEALHFLEDNSVNLVVTSPPFALQRKKAYGNEEQSEYVDWLCQFAKLVYRKLRDDGSFVIDIGGAYEKGTPSYSLYQFRALVKMCDVIGFKLAQPFYWHNPSGHVLGKSSWEKNNGGAIPPNLLQISNSESNSQYLRYCKACGVKGHPARFPAGIPEFFIKFLTDKGDLVIDISAEVIRQDTRQKSFAGNGRALICRGNM